MKNIFKVFLLLVLLFSMPVMASQNSTTLPTVSPYPGLTMLNNINSAFNTFQSNFSGATAPSSCVNYQFWIDSANSLLMFTPDCSNWYPVGSFSSGWVTTSNGFKQMAVTSTGSSNAYVVTYAPAPAAYVVGQVYSWITNFGVTGSATVNVNSIGALTLKKLGGSDLAAGDIGTGAAVACMYDGTNCQIVSELSTAATGTVTSVATNNGITGGTFTTSGTIALASVANNSVLCNNSGSSGAPTAANCGVTGTGNAVLATGPTIASAAMGASSTASTQTAGDSTTKLATTGFVNGTALTLANGTTAATQTSTDNSTKVATTAFVQGNHSTPTPLAVGSTILGCYTVASASLSAGATTSASNVLVFFFRQGSGWMPSGDSITGTWMTLQSIDNSVSGGGCGGSSGSSIGLWTRTL